MIRSLLSQCESNFFAHLFEMDEVLLAISQARRTHANKRNVRIGNCGSTIGCGTQPARLMAFRDEFVYSSLNDRTTARSEHVYFNRVDVYADDIKTFGRQASGSY